MHMLRYTRANAVLAFKATCALLNNLVPTASIALNRLL